MHIKADQMSTYYYLSITLLVVICGSSTLIAQDEEISNENDFDKLFYRYDGFEKSNGEYINTSNSRLHYLKIGESLGQCILWLHGTFGHSYDFLSFADSLSQEGYGSLAVDYYGHGQTIIYNDSASIYHLADDLKLLLQHEEVESCLIIGASRGGMIATAFYDEYPEMVDGIILIDGGSVPPVINVQKADEDIARKRIGEFTTPVDSLFESQRNAFNYLKHLNQNTSWKDINRIQKHYAEGEIFWGISFGLREWLWENSLDQVMDGAFRPHILPPFAASNLLISPKVVYRNLNVPLLIIDPIKRGDWLMDFESENADLAKMHQEIIIHKVYPDTYHNVLFHKPAKLYQDILDFTRLIK